MKNPVNRIKQSSQYTKDIEGFVYNGKDGSQIAYWTCFEDRNSNEYFHDFDEYLVCVQGQYNVHINGNTVILKPGDELFIPEGVPHREAVLLELVQFMHLAEREQNASPIKY